MVSSIKRSGRVKCHRYKGIEGLLRRIAFNLGNTPSLTEVKIISCIPIDVTDLQEKIVSLERQLEKTNGQQLPPPNRTGSKTVNSMTVNRFQVLYPQKSIESVDKQSNPALCPPVDSSENEYASPTGSPDTHQGLAKPRGEPGAAEDECRRGKPAIPEKARTQLVYFAQAETDSPFKNYEKVNTNNNETIEKTIDKKYLSSIIQRQYETGEVRDGLSQISTPVCRDAIEPVVQADISEDLCSCCQGQFFDLDHTKCREMTKQSTYTQNINKSNIYYDSNYYDVKPVKEQRNKNNKVPKKEISDTDLTFCPEYYPFKPEYFLNSNCLASHAHVDNKTIKRCPKKKYHTRQVFLQNDSSQTDGFVEFSHVYSKRLPSKHKSKLKPISKNAKCMAKIDCNIGYMNSKLIQTSSLSKLSSPTSMNRAAENYAYIERIISNAKCPVQPTKPLQTVSMSQLTSTQIGLNKVTFKNAECLTLAFNEIECQTDPMKCAQSEMVSPPEPNKTEATLEQIKSILQTVLTEVKTSQMQTIEEGKKTKERIVQDESILSPDCERLLGNMNCSPFAMNNPYQQMASCSRCLPTYRSSLMQQRLAMQPQAFEIPTDMGCVQNFPVFVHRQIATQACCPKTSAVMRPKQTSTNTLREKPKKRAPETETLIKEIYKSMALNVDCPIPTTSCTELGETKPTKVHEDAPNEFRTTNTMTQDREEIIYRGDVTSARREAKLKEHHSSDSFVSTRPQRRDSFYRSPRQVTSAMRREIQAKTFNKPDDGAEVKERLAENASDVENDDVISHTSSTPIKPPKGFFGKVLSSVFKKMRKKEEQPAQKEQGKTRASWSDHDLGRPKPRRVKHVSYAPDHPSRNARSISPSVVTSKTRRLAYLNPPARTAASSRRERDRRDTPYPSPEMPRCAPRSALRPQPGSSQDRRAQCQPPSYRKSSSFDVRRQPQNQLQWRRMDASHSYPNEPLRAKPLNTGIKLTNKTWMQKPVYHLGFACGPEKRKIMMNN